MQDIIKTALIENNKRLLTSRWRSFFHFFGFHCWTKWQRVAVNEYQESRVVSIHCQFRFCLLCGLEKLQKYDV